MEKKYTPLPADTQRYRDDDGVDVANEEHRRRTTMKTHIKRTTKRRRCENIINYNNNNDANDPYKRTKNAKLYYLAN